MFSIREKRKISAEVQKILQATLHPELPNGEIRFKLFVMSAESWSWAHIENNSAVVDPVPNPHNEEMDLRKEKS